MPKKGEIRLSTNLKHVHQALTWLEFQDRSTPMPIRTALGSNTYQFEKSRKTLTCFKTRLRKALYRKRRFGKNSVTLNVPKEEIVAFARSHDTHFIRTGLTKMRFRRLALSDDIVRSTRPRGRPKLTSVQRSKRFSKNYHIGDRQEPRIRRANQFAIRDATWSRGLRLRGETVLTDTAGPPEL